MRSAYIKRPPNNLVFYIDRRQAAAPEHGTTSSSMIFVRIPAGSARSIAPCGATLLCNLQKGRQSLEGQCYGDSDGFILFRVTSPTLIEWKPTLATTWGALMVTVAIFQIQVTVGVL